MPIGDRPMASMPMPMPMPIPMRVNGRLSACCRSGGQRGVTYLLLLFAIAIIGATLAVAGTAWATAAQRGAEAELMFRGESIRRAIVSYAQATPDGSPRLPATLTELLEDRRSLAPRHHLRQLYTDPFTGRADWVMVLEAGRLRGVHSRATRPALRSIVGPSGGVARDVSEWVFAATAEEVAPAPVLAAPAAPAASEPGP
ncbi:hypothetical protein BH11PSE9_BH11PSE9_19450 [soil metagenome]